MDNANTNSWHTNQLPKATWKLFQALGRCQIIHQQGFALAGGTNLALRFGHRVSVDLDFFAIEPFQKDSLCQHLIEQYPDLRITNETRQSLQMRIEGVKVEFLLHQYPQLEQTEQLQGLKLYALPDVAAMKLNALNNRGAKKDFYDVVELLQHHPLEKLLDWFAEKYKNTDKMSLVRALVYFDDAELDPNPLQSTRTWNKVKECLCKAQGQLIRNL